MQSKTDDLAFPVRVKFAVPSTGLGMVVQQVHDWLRQHIGTGRYAIHAGPALVTDAMVVHFIQIADALLFAETFADKLTLADGTLSAAYSSSYKNRSSLKWKEPLNMDAKMMIDAARSLSERLDRSLQNPLTPHVILTRDEAVLAQGLIDGLREVLEKEVRGGKI